MFEPMELDPIFFVVVNNLFTFSNGIVPSKQRKKNGNESNRTLLNKEIPFTFFIQIVNRFETTYLDDGEINLFANLTIKMNNVSRNEIETV